MARIMTWHDKGGDWLYDATGPEGLGTAAITVLQERVDQGYLGYPDDAEARAREILAAENGLAAFDFLMGRNTVPKGYVDPACLVRRP